MHRHTRPGRWVCAMFSAMILVSLATQAHAHFLFVRIGAPAEAGRFAEVFFSEQAEAGDPKFVAKIAHTKLWVQTRPGEFRELTVQQASDRLRSQAAVRSNTGNRGPMRIRGLGTSQSDTVPASLLPQGSRRQFRGTRPVDTMSRNPL